MSPVGKDAYKNESLSPLNHDDAKEEDITAFNAELENRNFHREVNRKNFKIMKSNALPSSVPISSPAPKVIALGLLVSIAVGGSKGLVVSCNASII